MNEGADLTAKGRLFHSLGARAEKARSPLMVQQKCGTVKSDWVHGIRRSRLYFGATPDTEILKFLT